MNLLEVDLSSRTLMRKQHGKALSFELLMCHLFFNYCICFYLEFVDELSNTRYPSPSSLLDLFHIEQFFFAADAGNLSVSNEIDVTSADLISVLRRELLCLLFIVYDGATKCGAFQPNESSYFHFVYN